MNVCEKYKVVESEINVKKAQKSDSEANKNVYQIVRYPLCG